MVQVGYDNTESDYGEPIRYNLGHEQRYVGTIAEVSDIKEMEFKYDDEPKERLVITFRTPLEELDVDDDTREQLRDHIESEIQERKDAGKTVDHPEDAVELIMLPTAKVTPPVGNYSSSKLYNTLNKLGLAEAGEDGDVTLYNREGEEVNPFADAEDDEEAMNEAFSDYLKQNLVGMKVEYEINNANRGEDDEYSSVGKVIDLEEDPQVEG